MRRLIERAVWLAGTWSGRKYVRAAGGLVWREAGDGGLELLVIHRRRLRDWTLPKGRLEPGEDEGEAAVREVREEAGLTCRIEGLAGAVDYRDPLLRRKRARYWWMRPLEGAFEPNEAFDEARWVSPRDAVGLLSHRREREIVRSAAPPD